MNAWLTRIRVALAASALLLGAGASQAGAIFFAGELKDGRFVPDKAVTGPCYTVRYSTITAEIDGRSATTRIAETIAGPAGKTCRTVCIVPLPEGVAAKSAAVTAASDGGKPHRLDARFLSADEARRVLQAVAKGTGQVTVLSLAGRSALLVEQFPLGAKTEVTVSFSQPIVAERRVQFYACPMPATAWARGPVARLSLTATVTSDRPLRAMFSPSHTATVEREHLRKAIVRVKADDWAGRDDFRLCYVADTDDLGLRVLAHRPVEGEDGYFLLIGNPTGSVEKRQVLPKDVLFVLDTSGSMRGEKIEQARAAVEYCLDHLHEGDRFNVVAFGTEVAGFRGEPVGRSKANVDAAKGFIDSLVARGRTNISGALAKGLAGKPQAGRLRIMIFLTDGTPTAGLLVPDKIIAKLPAMNASATRIFVMGVGHDVNAHLLDKLAEATGGSSEYVEPDEEIDVKIAALYDRLSNPVLGDVKVAFGELRPTAVFPKKLPTLFAGSEIMIAGRYRKAGPQKVTLSGTLAGRAVTYTCLADLPAKTADDRGEFVASLWAARKIGFLLREIRLNGENKELIEEIVRLSTKFGIITEYTGFLADASRPGPVTPGKLDKAALEEVTGRLREARSRQSGQWAVNQAVNEQDLQNRVVATANLYRDRRGKTVANDNVRQVGGRAFYLRDGQWVDASPAAGRKARRVKLFSKDYFDLLRSNKDFSRAQALGWNVKMNVGAEQIVVEKDGKVRDESMRVPAPRQQNVGQRNLRGQNQQINQLDQKRIRQLLNNRQKVRNEQAPSK